MSNITVQPYLFFSGRCEEALAFYTKTIGAKVDMLMLFKDSPDPLPSDVLQPGFENKVMHSSFRVGGALIMASDGCNDEDQGFKGFSLHLALPTIPEVENAFNALADGGQVNMALAKTFWSPMYGILTDRFGISWMVSVADAQ